MIIDESEYLAHYGTPRKSGRYPWGSGDNETGSTRNQDFLGYVDELKSQGFSEQEIAKAMNSSTTEFRARKTIALNEQKQANITQALRLKDKGMSTVAIGRQMGVPESTVRTWLKPDARERADILLNTANVLQRQVDEKKFLDIGSGTEQMLDVSSTKMNAAVAILKEKGYTVHTIPVTQLGTGKETNVKVLALPGTTWGDVKRSQSEIRQIQEFSEDGGRTHLGLHPPIAIDPKRVAVKYGSEGGKEADGVIYVRPGVPDVSIGNSRYAQVRVQVGNDHYLKGMAVYKDDLPPGVDLLFNTNKENTGNKIDAFKPMKDDPDNPFGAVVRQIVKRDSDGLIYETTVANRHLIDGTERVISSMNIVNEEGNWASWSKTLSTQMLSKQDTRLAKTQLDLTYERRVQEFDQLSKLTNPTVKKMLLEKFGDETDSAAVHLDAAAISKRQAWHTILPVSTMPETQIYAPRFKDGERVVLIRYPHAGKFEIPELVVNNKHPEAKKLLGNAPDAVGIHHTVAEKLSGADFDGDTVLVIPNNNKRVQTAPTLKELQNFDHRAIYKAYEGMPRMTKKQEGIEMGSVSNLITDMTIRGAPVSDIARAVKHSMVVIDAEKHHLNWKQSALDNNIPQLKERYQGGKGAGASTLISRATAERRIDDRKPRPASQGGPIDRETGKREYVPTGKVNYKSGKPKQIKVEALSITDNAFDLVSQANTPMERLYAEHSNKLKTLANRARKDAVNTPTPKYSPSAKKVYSEEVKTLNAKLSLAVRNRPLERQAQIVANTLMKAKLTENPNMDVPTRKKLESQALNEGRTRTGAKAYRIEITPDEWNAIQAGAISPSKLTQILAKSDLDTVRKLATPRAEKKMSATAIQRAQDMFNSGATRAEVAEQLGVSVSTLDQALKEEG